MRPWVNVDILADILESDKIYRYVTNTKDPTRKAYLFQNSKRKGTRFLLLCEKVEMNIMLSKTKIIIKKRGKEQNVSLKLTRKATRCIHLFLIREK